MHTDTKTLGFDEEQIWQPPVDERSQLADDAEEDVLCFVKCEGRVYERRRGGWFDTHALPRSVRR